MEALSFLEKVKEKVWDPYMGLEEKMESLGIKMKVLISRRDDTMAETKHAELHSSKRRKTEIDNWFCSVQKLEHEFQCLDQEVQQSSNSSRIGLSYRADKIHKEVEDLLEQGKFSEGILLNENEEKLQLLVSTNLKGQTFVQSLREVLVSLSEVSSVGIYGMGGVGKTTLAMHIHDHLLQDSTFSSNVYWITVSQNFSITKMRNRIAKNLGIDLSSEDEDKKRAAKLFQSLKRMKSFVLILDDLWNTFDVEKVGIPLENGGGKLIITSRSVEVCDGMGCKRKVNVGTLSPAESWELFMEKLDHYGDLRKEIQEVAMKMTKKCDGLPLGLITIAASMRGVTDVFEWRDAYEDFKESCMEVVYMNDKVFPILRYSYNRLRDQRLQKCFLYCCLYPEDYKIERDELIRLFIVEEFLVRRNSRQAEFDQGHAILNKLERACLLERVVDREGRICVRMHDLVREMALQIARDEFKWMVKAGAQLGEIPREQEWSEDLDKVSLMSNDIREILEPLSNGRPMLTTLLQRNNYHLTQIVDNFFVQMLGLCVLDLSYTDIKRLPRSVSNLENLSALLLRCCGSLKFVPPLNKLKKLIELDLYGTRIEEVPQGLGSLVNLKFLDLRRHMAVLVNTPFKNPAVDILARLSNLQSLSSHFVIRVEHLLGMRQLEIFHGLFVDVCSYNRFVKYQQTKLNAYEIVLDPTQHSDWFPCGNGKRVQLKGLVVTGDNLDARDATLLPLDTQELEIVDSRFRTSSNSFLDAIPSLIQSKDLREIKIRGCGGVKFLMRLSHCSSMGERMTGDDALTSTCCPFEYLECLSLVVVSEFAGLCKLELGEALPPVGTFSHLRHLYVVQCNQMKKLIPRWLLQYLLNLTKIDVGHCLEMEEIIAEDEEEQFNQCASSASPLSILPSNQSRSINDDEVVLPNLKYLDLWSLPKLKSIYKERMTCGSIKCIKAVDCPKLKRLPFTLPLQDGQPSAPPDLELINMEEEIWESLEWDHPQYKNVLHPLFGKY